MELVAEKVRGLKVGRRRRKGADRLGSMYC